MLSGFCAIQISFGSEVNAKFTKQWVFTREKYKLDFPRKKSNFTGKYQPYFFRHHFKKSMRLFMEFTFLSRKTIRISIEIVVGIWSDRSTHYTVLFARTLQYSDDLTLIRALCRKFKDIIKVAWYDLKIVPICDVSVWSSQQLTIFSKAFPDTLR